MIKLLFIFCIFFLQMEACEQSLSSELEKCLLETYRVDPLSCGKILEKFSLLLESQEYDSVVSSFIEESGKLSIYDGIREITAENTNSPRAVLFENDFLKISWASTKSGEQEPSQIHPWKTLMVVIRPSEFYTLQENGIFYEDNWPIGVYVLEPSIEALSCKNIGPEEYNGLIFEMKTNEIQAIHNLLGTS